MNPYDSTDDAVWINTTASTGTLNFTFITNGTFPNYTSQKILPNKDWMPYRYVEYEPKWHKKFARYKLQMQSMWD
jgi:hypothetical protein